MWTGKGCRNRYNSLLRQHRQDAPVPRPQDAGNRRRPALVASRVENAPVTTQRPAGASFDRSLTIPARMTTRLASGVVAKAGIAALLLVTPASSTADDSVRTVTWPAHTMGTYVHVAIVTADSAAREPDARAALAVFFRVDSLMSNWTTTSEVARVNREAASGPTTVQPEVAGVIARSLEVWRGSDGAFDITVEPLIRAWGFLGGKPHVPDPDVAAEAYRHVGATKLEFDPAARTLYFKEPGVRIDLGGIAKGYAVDAAAETLEARGIRDALVDLSGNMMALGHPPGAEAWRIGIPDPRDPMAYFPRLTLHHESISTSGQYEHCVAANAA